MWSCKGSVLAVVSKQAGNTINVVMRYDDGNCIVQHHAPSRKQWPQAVYTCCHVAWCLLSGRPHKWLRSGWFELRIEARHVGLTCNILRWPSGAPEWRRSRWWCRLPLPGSWAGRQASWLCSQEGAPGASRFQCPLCRGPQSKPSHLELSPRGCS